MGYYKIYTNKFVDLDPTVYLISYLRDDIIKYVVNPYQYLIKMEPKLYTILSDEMRNPLGTDIRFMKVLVKPDCDVESGYIIYRGDMDYPNLDAWWECLDIDKKVKLYIENK